MGIALFSLLPSPCHFLYHHTHCCTPPFALPFPCTFSPHTRALPAATTPLYLHLYAILSPMAPIRRLAPPPAHTRTAHHSHTYTMMPHTPPPASLLPSPPFLLHPSFPPIVQCAYRPCGQMLFFCGLDRGTGRPGFWQNMCVFSFVATATRTYPHAFWDKTSLAGWGLVAGTGQTAAGSSSPSLPSHPSCCLCMGFGISRLPAFPLLPCHYPTTPSLLPIPCCLLLFRPLGPCSCCVLLPLPVSLPPYPSPGLVSLHPYSLRTLSLFHFSFVESILHRRQDEQNLRHVLWTGLQRVTMPDSDKT